MAEIENQKLQLKRSRTNISSYTPAMGEPIFDIARKQLRIGDDTTAGGVIPKELFYTPITSEAEISAEEGSCVVVDCRENSIKVNLPDATNLSSGSIVKIMDAYYAASTEKTIEISSTAKINGEESSLVVDIPRAYIAFIWIAETSNWIVDLGGAIVPSNEIKLTDELEFTSEGKLGVRSVSFSKVEGPMDFGTF